MDFALKDFLDGREGRADRGVAGGAGALEGNVELFIFQLKDFDVSFVELDIGADVFLDDLFDQRDFFTLGHGVPIVGDVS